MNSETIESRFIAAVLKDADGTRWRECRALDPEAFQNRQHRADWRNITQAPSFDEAVLGATHYLTHATLGESYIADRDELWFSWLKLRGPSFAREWVATLPAHGGKFPELESEPAEREILADVEPIIERIMEAGDKLVLASGSKSFKTWTLIQLCMAISTGTPWLGFTTHKRRVLFLNFEIKPHNFWRRVYRVRRALGLGKAEGFAVWNLRGRGFSMDSHADELIKRAKEFGASVIVLDPIYKLFGDRNESSAGDMATLMTIFDRVATESGAAIVFAHHFAKGDPTGKDAIDRASGSGVFARDPDCIITLTRLDESEGENAFQVAVTLREFAPIDDFAVRREHPIMVRDEGANVRNLHAPNQRKAKYSADQLVALLPEGGLSAAEWQRLAHECLGMTRSTFYVYAPAAKKAARLVGTRWFKPTPRSDRSDRSDLGIPDRRTWSESGIKNTIPDSGPVQSDEGLNKRGVA